MNSLNFLLIISGLNIATATLSYIRPSSSIIVIEDPKGVCSKKNQFLISLITPTFTDLK